ncbi:hypothetical protein D3C76_1467400 [compost metagenome]
MSITPRRIRPTLVRSLSSDCLSALAVSSICSAYSSTLLPSGVRLTPRESRSSSLTPRSASSAAMRLEIDAWVVKSFSAVRRKLLSRATQTKVSRNLRFMLRSLIKFFLCQTAGFSRWTTTRGHRKMAVTVATKIAAFKTIPTS